MLRGGPVRNETATVAAFWCRSGVTVNHRSHSDAGLGLLSPSISGRGGNNFLASEMREDLKTHGLWDTLRGRLLARKC